ncbi:MAG: aldo/keto reductase [Clostridiales bacterium]|nr:aldo/keto reductase [Clostridiales bacterium]
MTLPNKKYTLKNGVTIPNLGFGTWQVPDGSAAYDAVAKALEVGYRHIDTAAVYGNEKSVGKAIKNSGIPREELFITTKLWNDSHSYGKALAAFEASMEKLELETLDLYLIHWPNPPYIRNHFEESTQETWSAMEKLYQSGKARAIGVSNYLPHHLDVLLKNATIVPMVNQIRLYPGSFDQKTIEYCVNHDILLQAYSPLGKGNVLSAPEILAIADRYEKTPAQVALRWSLQRNFLPLPKSVTPERMKENMNVFDFTLTDEDMHILNTMKNYGDELQNPDTTDF